MVLTVNKKVDDSELHSRLHCNNLASTTWQGLPITASSLLSTSDTRVDGASFLKIQKIFSTTIPLITVPDSSLSIFSLLCYYLYELFNVLFS